MTKHYIRPEDVSAHDAGKVLDFLNSAQSAEQIAETIEIPGEPDVGLGVAQRILDRRKALGNSFTSLEQIAAIPYVGPERFTEIISVLTGMRPPSPPSDSDFQARILHELQALRGMVTALQAEAGQAYKISLRADLETAFIGQPVILTAEVRDRVSGKRQPNVRLTLASGWGNIQTQVGFERKQGRVITVYTDLNGTAEVVFFPPTAENLSPAQQAALETALRSLDPLAHSPMDILPQLEQMALQYQADNNRDLRSAIDIYFSRRQEQLVNAVNHGSQMGTWEYSNALITAYVHEGFHDDYQNTSVQCMAALNLDLKDWLKPFYAAFLMLSEKESGLQEDIDSISSQIEDSDELLDGILDNLYAFIGVQSGRVGEAAGQKIAKKAVNHFMATGFESLPLESRQSIFPALSIAAKSIRADTMGSLAVSTRIRKDVKTDVAGQLEPLGDVSVFIQNVETVKGQLDQFQADYSDFRGDTEAFSKDYEKFSVDYGDFSRNYPTFESNYNIFTSNYRVFDQKYEKFNADYGDFTTDYSMFSEKIGAFDNSYAAFRENYAGFNTGYKDFTTKNTAFTANYKTFRSNYAGFETNLGTFSRDFQTFKTDYAKFRNDYDKLKPIR
jgi:hypothetical protein